MGHPGQEGPEETGAPRMGGDRGDRAPRMEGAPQTGGDGVGAAQTAMNRSGQRRTRRMPTRASWAWPVNPTCGITWKVPQADSSLRELAQESAFSNNFYKWI